MAPKVKKEIIFLNAKKTLTNYNKQSSQNISMSIFDKMDFEFTNMAIIYIYIYKIFLQC
jgi:hypothetical protein